MVEATRVPSSLKRDITHLHQERNGSPVKKQRIAEPEVSWKKCRQMDLPARKSVLSQICNEMRRAKPHCSEVELEKLKDAARQIELALYEAAPSKAEYVDMSTLQVRIRSFLAESQGKTRNSFVTPQKPAKRTTLTGNKATDQLSSVKKPKSTDVVVKIRRRRLLKLYHASNCKDKDCSIVYCAETKKLFQHVVHCAKESCSFEKCVSSRYLLVHFRVCSSAACAVCSAVREQTDKKQEKGSTNKMSLFSNHYVRSSIQTLSTIVSKKDKKSEVKKKPPVEKTVNLIDKKYVRWCVSGSGPSFLDHLSVAVIGNHLRALKVEKLQPIVFPVLRKLMEHKHNRNIFNLPVDPVALNIPHYLEVIKQPMDLGTVRQKLEDRKYSDFHTFDTDIRLVFMNAMKFNPAHHPVHVIAARFLQTYEVEVEKLRPKLLNNYKYHSRFSRQPNSKSKCNLCFQAKCEVCPLCERGCLAYEPRVIYCSANCTARIQRNVYYYCTPGHTFCFCTDCVEKQKKKTVVEVQGGGTKVKKSDLIKKKNNDLISEPWVSCDKCDKWCHQTCALYNPRKDDLSKTGNYICPACLMKEKETKSVSEENIKKPLKAADLPHTDLCSFIEKWIRNKYEALQEEASRSTAAIKGDAGPPSQSLTVRLIHNYDEVCKLKPFAKKCLDQMPHKIKYNSKCLALFQELDGVDTLIFVMFVQEYGDDLEVTEENKKESSKESPKVKKEQLPSPKPTLAHPNRRKIYIAYLDSIHYFRPRRFRTNMYQSLMLSYLEYSRRRGFFNAYIWACPPPNKRDDYILHCHPEDQRVPNPERLRKWYHTMAETGMELGVVSSTSSIFAEHFVPKEEVPVEAKGRKSKKKAMADIIAANKSKNKNAGKSGKELLFESEADVIAEKQACAGGKRGPAVRADTREWKKNKLAFNQKMPYFDGDYWPQELEDIGKEEERQRSKKNKPNLKVKQEPEQPLVPLSEMSSTEIRTTLFSRLADQLYAMKQDFLVVKLAYDCIYCGKYLPTERYECRHPDCLLVTAHPEKNWDKRSTFVLCKDCVKVEEEKPEDERHSGKLALCCGNEFNCESTKQDDSVALSTRLRVNDVKETHQLVKITEMVSESLIDKNPLKKSEYMETRHAFLALCAGNRYQFNQLRRAKASTLQVLYHLHNPKAPAHLYTCSKCQKDILSKFRYHCTKCAEFNLCEDCYNSSRHEHPLHSFLVTRTLKQQNNSEAERNLADSRRARVQSIQIYLHFLHHATKCKNKNCKLEFCVKIKSIFEHSRNCPHKNNVAACAPCRDLFILLKLKKQRDQRLKNEKEGDGTGASTKPEVKENSSV